MAQMSLAVVGSRYPNADGSDRLEEIARCAAGEPVELRPEPTNRHDPRAVAVFSIRGVQIGYLTAERCGRIGALIGEGRELRAVVQGSTEFGTWLRIAFDGEEPVLPLQRATPARGLDSYTDKEVPGLESQGVD
ncbi:MAG: HIRAN domain-containing protein [Novosphingobium sp.]|nr:HIRAN domain-containing protein [Novosphingobium sp.]